MSLKKIKELGDLSVDSKAIDPETKEIAKQSFVECWPNTRKNLENMMDVLKKRILKFIIGVVISAGDEMFDILVEKK